MSSSIPINSPERLPASAALLIPGALSLEPLRELHKHLQPRPILWLIEENAELPAEIQAFLTESGHPGMAFSPTDPPVENGEALRQKLGENGLALFIPKTLGVRPGNPCHIPAETLRFLTSLGLPVSPLDLTFPDQLVLATENTASLPAAILTFGELVKPGENALPDFLQSLLAANQEAFASRSFLNDSLPYHLLAGLKKHPGNRIIDGSDDSILGFDRILPAALALSREIRKQTDKKRVGIILPPGKGGLLANLGVLFAGRIPVNLNFTASHEAIRSSIRQADLDKFITADPFVRKIPAFPWPPNRDLIFIERLLPHIKKEARKWALAAKFLPLPILLRLLGLKKNGGDTEALLLFTSGSSGEPKGVPLTHRNVLANVCQFATPLDLATGASIVGSLPLFHSFGCTVTLWFPVIQGLDLITYPNPLDCKRLATLISEHQATVLLATPTFLRGYMRRVEPELLKSLKLVVTGAEKLPENLAQSFEDTFGILPMEGYGLTETSPATNVNLPPPENSGSSQTLPTQKLGSVGRNLPGLALKITNPADGKPLPLSKSGVIWFKGPNIFPGYLGDPELSEDSLIDGWLKTDDVGRMDDEGFLHIEGRISRFSKVAGEMVPHENVEAAINKILNLDGETERKIAVMGRTDSKKGETLVLLSTISGPALEQECLDIRYKLMDLGLPSLWCPKTIISVHEIPILASGKLDIKACKELAEG